MATIETPPTRPSESGYEANDVPVLLVKLQDDLARARMREAFWMSLFFHLLIAVSLATSPQWVPAFSQKPIVVATPQDLIQQRELTYLDLPPDMQKPQERPDTNVISDKDRIASKRPSLDRKELQKILDSARPGAPGRPSVPSPPVQQAPAPQVAQAQQGQQTPDHGQQQAQQQAPGTGQPNDQGLMAKLEPPPQTKAPAGGAFGGALSPGKMIEQAARAAASRPGGGSYGGGGDYGLGTRGTDGKVRDGLEVLSDTMGVDFGPYLSRVLHDVRLNWYNLIPEVARAPLMKRGKVSIEFAITKDGSVAGMRLISGSGDVSLDRAAWGGITASNRFPPLPNEFRGNYLALRFHFFYNPDRNELQ